jgi:transcriptional regulator with XRE-family HTH domain
MRAPNEHRERTGALVRALRRSRRITQAELAARVGLTRTSICNIEAGRQSLDIERFNEIVEALDYVVRLQIKPKGASNGNATG